MGWNECQTRGSNREAVLADLMQMFRAKLSAAEIKYSRQWLLNRQLPAYDYTEIGQIVDKSPTNCRQIVRRAKQHLTSHRPRFEVPLRRQEQIVEQFLQACNVGDLQGLIALLAEDITLWSDGGGRVTAALKPLYGTVKVAKVLLAIRSQKFGDFTYQLGEINGQPGVVSYVSDHLRSIMTFNFTGDRIQSVFIVVNPDKLKQVADSNLNLTSLKL